MTSKRLVIKVQDDSVSARYTTPSILYSPEKARGFDCKYISEIGLNGLNKIRLVDKRFSHYIRGPKKVRNEDAMFITNDLFSLRDKEIDRKSLGKEELIQIDESIHSYLRLLPDYLELPGAIETLEYLIRIYRIHVHNWEVLLLTVLHSHEKPVFVRIVQLLPIRNSKWEFLVDVVTHGVPLTPDLLIQKCKEDVQVLQALCEYAPKTETGNKPPSETVVIFTTEVVVGVLGSMTTVDKDFIELIKAFVNPILQYGVRGDFCHNSALLVIGILAKRAQNLQAEWFMKAIMCSVGSISNDANIRISITTLVSFIQDQSVTKIPIGVLRPFKEKSESVFCSKISAVIQELSEELDLTQFMSVLLLSFLRHSESKFEWAQVLVSVIDTVPLESELVGLLIMETFSMCLVQIGGWARLILQAAYRKYSDVLERSVGSFLADATEGDAKWVAMKYVLDLL